MTTCSISSKGSRHNHFPVVDDHGACVGMIHYGDLRDIMYDPTLRELVTAHDLCRQTTAVTTLDVPLNELFKTFQESDIGCLAVVEGEGVAQRNRHRRAA